MNWRPEPIKARSIVAFYNTRERGQLSYVNYAREKNKPRPGWSYRGERRNAARPPRVRTKS
jgi:hypothetical protein